MAKETQAREGHGLSVPWKLEDIMLSPAKIEDYRERLLELAHRLRGQVSDLEDVALQGLGGESGGGISNTPTHPADLGNAHYQGEVELLLLENETGLLSDCYAALDRIAAGRFGKCEECDRQLSEGRLQAFPHARYCVQCSRKIEEEEAY
jgi:RNA polymerase-binding transcription factor DksA